MWSCTIDNEFCDVGISFCGRNVVFAGEQLRDIHRYPFKRGFFDRRNSFGRAWNLDQDVRTFDRAWSCADSFTFCAVS
jgi:hypothetical protein